MQSSRFASCLADYFALLDCLPGLTYRVHFTGRYTERLRVRSAYHKSELLILIKIRFSRPIGARSVVIAGVNCKQ